MAKNIPSSVKNKDKRIENLTISILSSYGKTPTFSNVIKEDSKFLEDKVYSAIKKAVSQNSDKREEVLSNIEKRLKQQDSSLTKFTENAFKNLNSFVVDVAKSFKLNTNEEIKNESDDESNDSVGNENNNNKSFDSSRNDLKDSQKFQKGTEKAIENVFTKKIALAKILNRMVKGQEEEDSQKAIFLKNVKTIFSDASDKLKKYFVGVGKRIADDFEDVGDAIAGAIGGYLVSTTKDEENASALTERIAEENKNDIKIRSESEKNGISVEKGLSVNALSTIKDKSKTDEENAKKDKEISAKIMDATDDGNMTSNADYEVSKLANVNKPSELIKSIDSDKNIVVDDDGQIVHLGVDGGDDEGTTDLSSSKDNKPKTENKPKTDDKKESTASEIKPIEQKTNLKEPPKEEIKTEKAIVVEKPKTEKKVSLGRQAKNLEDFRQMKADALAFGTNGGKENFDDIKSFDEINTREYLDKNYNNREDVKEFSRKDHEIRKKMRSAKLKGDFAEVEKLSGERSELSKERYKHFNDWRDGEMMKRYNERNSLSPQDASTGSNLNQSAMEIESKKESVAPVVITSAPTVNQTTNNTASIRPNTANPSETTKGFVGKRL